MGVGLFAESVLGQGTKMIMEFPVSSYITMEAQRDGQVSWPDGAVPGYLKKM